MNLEQMNHRRLRQGVETYGLLLALLGCLASSGCQPTPSTSKVSDSPPQMPLPQTATQQTTAVASPEVNPAPPLATSSPATRTQIQVTTPTTGTRLETNNPQAQTAVTVEVQQALTALNAQTTGQGILINLPDNILFDFDQFTIRAAAKPTLAQLSVLLRHYGNAPIAINGHTDSKGSTSYNQTLSQRRADAVKIYLANNFGISAGRMSTRGYGETQPVAANTNPNGSDNPTGRQKNRRVEVIIGTSPG